MTGDPIVVAWTGVGLTAAINLGAVAFFWGRLSEVTRSLRRDLDKHTESLIPQGHGCPYFRPERHSEER